jgi:hypothetical protein
VILATVVFWGRFWGSLRLAYVTMYRELGLPPMVRAGEMHCI